MNFYTRLMIPFSPRLPPSSDYYLGAAITKAFPNNPMLWRTCGLTILSVIYTVVLLASDTSSAASAKVCYVPGTLNKAADSCTCKSPYTGVLCDRLDYKDDKGIHYQSISSISMLSFTRAKALCTASGMGMATPWSKEENAAILTIMGTSPTCFLGISQLDKVGTWKYISGPREGKTIWEGGVNGSADGDYYTNWETGNPTNGRRSTHITTSGKWVNKPPNPKCVICDNTAPTHIPTDDIPSKTTPTGPISNPTVTVAARSVPPNVPTTMATALKSQTDTSFGGGAPKTAAIVGGVVGAIVIVVVIAGVIFLYKRNLRKKVRSNDIWEANDDTLMCECTEIYSSLSVDDDSESPMMTPRPGEDL